MIKLGKVDNFVPCKQIHHLSDSVKVPLLNDLAPDGFFYGGHYIIEFDSDSLWYETSLTLAALALKQGLKTEYHVFQHFPSEAIEAFTRLGVDAEKMEKDGLLNIWDSYTDTLEYETEKKKLHGADQNMWVSTRDKPLNMTRSAARWGETAKAGLSEKDKRWLHIDDNTGIILQYNDEKEVIDAWRIGMVPYAMRARESPHFLAFVKGGASDTFYTKYEALCDGIIDLKAEEVRGKIESYIRIRTLRGKTFDSSWHRLMMGNNGEVRLVGEGPQAQQRRLAAIMFTDMVGFTALGQRNESLSLGLLEEQRKLVRPTLARHNGREVKTIGDAFLVEFPNALDAAKCAYDIQRVVREFNLLQPEVGIVHLRVGIHLGDVVESQGDISGDAVNVASRIESLAPDGGVCLTREVYSQVRNKFELPLISIGPKSLKNVAEPMEVYRMVMPWEKEAALAPVQLDRNRIAVLPFANMSPDPNDAFFADGMTEEMISTISGVNELSVISRTSVMGYKGTTKKVGEIGNELKAGSILEGSIRKAGNRLRVTAQLIDANTDQHLWARSYDRELKDVFAIQSDIAQKVVEAMKVTLIPSEEGKIGRIRTRNMSAYESYLKGISVATQPLGRFADSVKFLEEAIRQDPEFSTAYSALGNFYLENAGEVIPLREGMEKAESLIEKALQIDDGSPDSHVAKGNLEMQYHLDYDVAERELTKGLDLSPGNSSAHLWYGVLLMVTRRLEEAVRELQIARELDPLSLPVAVNLVNALAITENYDDAITLMERSAKLEPHVAWYHLELALLYLRVGRVKEADDEVARAQPPERTTWEEAMLAQDLALLGRGNQAREVLAKLEGNREAQFVSPTHLAKAYCALGEGERALTLLEQDFEAGPVGFLFYSQLPDFDQIRDDPRFVSMGEKLRLPNAP